MTSRRAGALLGALLVVCAPLDAARGEDAPSVEKLRQALDRTIDLDLAAESFDDVVEHFRAKTKLDLTLDRAYLAQFGIDPTAKLPEPIKRTMKGVKVRDALRRVFDDQHLVAVVVDGPVLLTGEEQAVQRQMAQRVRVSADGVPLEAALKKVAGQTAVNVVLDRRGAKEAATAKVELQVEDVSVETAVRLLAEMAGAKAVRMDNVLFVTSRAQANEILADQRASQAVASPGSAVFPGGLPPGFGALGALGGGGGFGALGIGGGGGGGLGIGGGGNPVLPPPQPRKPGTPEVRRRDLTPLAFAVAAADDTAAQVEPKKSESPAALLFKPMTFGGIDDPKTTLAEALELVGRQYGVAIDVNDEAFKQDGLALPEAPFERTIRKMPAATLDRVLTRLLARVPSATYLTRGDHIEVTTQRALHAEIWGNHGGPYLPLVHATFEQRTLAEALRELADQSGLNVVVDGRVAEKARTPVTARLVNAPVDTAVRLLADMAELRPYLVDNTIYVTTKENADAWEKREKIRLGDEGGSAARVGFGPRGAPTPAAAGME